MNRMLKISLLLTSALVLTACGFHLRQSVALPPSMQHIHLSVYGGGDLQRILDRALTASGVDVEEKPGPDIAELKITNARFSNDMLTISGYAQVTEYAVHYYVDFHVENGTGKMLLPPQSISMSRNYSYDSTNTIGSSGQVEEIQRGLNDDMVQAILFRLQAAEKRAEQAKHEVAPASAASTQEVAPAPAVSID